MVIAYQNDRCLPSLNDALVELIETHPRIAELVEAVYASSNGAPLP